MKLSSYFKKTLDIGYGNKPGANEVSWNVGTEDTVAILAFVIAILFLLFMGIGWLDGKATTAQFIQVGTATVSAFAGIVIGIIKAKKAEKTGNKGGLLTIIQWLLIAITVVVGGLALYRTF